MSKTHEEVERQNLKRVLAKNIRRQKMPLFITHESIDAVIEAQGLRGEAIVAVMIAVNTTLELIAKEIENGNVNS